MPRIGFDRSIDKLIDQQSKCSPAARMRPHLQPPHHRAARTRVVEQDVVALLVRFVARLGARPPGMARREGQCAKKEGGRRAQKQGRGRELHGCLTTCECACMMLWIGLDGVRRL